MADPRDELTLADVANEPGWVPPREPLRIRVSPYDTPPPSDTGWGGFGAGGRPTGRLFEPDQTPGPEEQFQQGIRATPWFKEFVQQYGEEPDLNTPDYDYRKAWAAGSRPDVRDPGDNQFHWSSQFKGPNHPHRFVNGVDTITGQPTEGGPQPPWQGGRLFEPDQSPAPPKAQWQPGILSAVPIARGIGSLVQGARDAWNAPPQPAGPPVSTAPPLVSPGRGRSNAPFDPMTGVRPAEGYPNAAPAANLGGIVDTIGHAATEVLQEPYNLVRAGQDVRAPGATDQQVQQARQQEAGAATNLTSNLFGLNAPFSAARPGATAGLFGGRLSPAADQKAFDLAERMQARGAPEAQIRRVTGLTLFPDKKFRFEVSDHEAYYKGIPNAYDPEKVAKSIFLQTNPNAEAKDFGTSLYRLSTLAARQVAEQRIANLPSLKWGDLMHHPEAEKAFPYLKDMPVEIDHTMHALGSYGPPLRRGQGTGVFKLRPTDSDPRGQTFKVLLHEPMHKIQDVERFALGGNPDYIPLNSPAYKIYQDKLAQLRAQNIPISPEAEQAAYSAAGREHYRRLAGENEANVVMDRMDLSPEQRAAISPLLQMKVMRKNQIVDFGEAEQLPLLSGGRGQMGGVLNPAPREMQMSAPKPQPSGAKFPQYAERYPEVGPPTQAVDPKSGKEYLAKQLTPEAEAFAKELGRVDKAMAKEGYTPYFDPSKREHVDPKHYPPNVDTRTIIPKKLTEKDEALIPIVTGEESRARLRAAYQRGTEMPNTKNWYAMKQLEDEFIKEFGPEAGRKAFQEKIATSMGATTGGADPTTNWRMAQYGNYLRQNNLPYPVSAHEMPYPIGGRFAGQNIALHKKIFDEGGFPALGKEYPKRHNFSQNFTGNRGAATMDEQMSNLMTPGTLMPPKGRYGYYENTLGEEAAKVGVLPQNYQDVAWSGAKNLKDPRYKSGEPFIQTINESIERTHRLTGMPREEIVRRGIIRSEIPMYGMAGPNPIGSLVDPEGYNR